MDDSIAIKTEKRKYSRLVQTMPVRFKVDKAAKEYESMSKNISKGGMFMSTPRLPGESKLRLQQPKSTVNLVINFPLTISSVRLKAKIVRVEQDGVGLEFVNVPLLEKKRLSSYIFEEMSRPKRRVFTFEKTVYLTDTNAEGNVYFARYFEWQGMAREEFLKQVVPDCVEIFSKVKFITIEASTRYKHEAKLFDQIVIEIVTNNIKDASFELIFTYLNKKTRQIIATGKEVIAFGDFSGSLIPIPKQIREIAEYFLEFSLIK